MLQCRQWARKDVSPVRDRSAVKLFDQEDGTQERARESPITDQSKLPDINAALSQETIWKKSGSGLLVCEQLELAKKENRVLDNIYQDMLHAARWTYTGLLMRPSD